MHILVAGNITDEQVERLKALYEEKDLEPLDGEVVRITRDQAESIGQFYRNSVPWSSPDDKGSTILTTLLRRATGKPVSLDSLVVIYDTVSLHLLSETLRGVHVSIMTGNIRGGAKFSEILVLPEGLAYLVEVDLRSDPVKVEFVPLGQL